MLIRGGAARRLGGHGRARRGWRGRGRRRRRYAASGGPRLSVDCPAGQGPAFLDLGGLVDGEFAGLDGPDPAVRPDHDLFADDEVRDRALQVHLVGCDSVRLEFAATAEESTGPADVHLRAVDHWHADVPAELDVDLAGLQGPAELPPAGEPELLRGRAPPDGHAPADVDLLRLPLPTEREGAGTVDLLSPEVPVHLRGPGRVELPRPYVPLEDARACRLREVRLEVPGDAA